MESLLAASQQLYQTLFGEADALSIEADYHKNFQLLGEDVGSSGTANGRSKDSLVMQLEEAAVLLGFAQSFKAWNQPML